MAETKFTPGPWYLHEAFVRPGMGNVRGMWVRRVFGENEDQWKDSRIALATGRADENLSVVVAIGNLIAAAPELYQALEKAVESYGKPGGPWNCPDEPGAWLAMAQAALAKARGEMQENG